MTIAIDFVGTNLGSGTKTYNINFCNQLNKVELTENIKIFICKSYLNHIALEINESLAKYNWSVNDLTNLLEKFEYKCVSQINSLDSVWKHQP